MKFRCVLSISLMGLLAFATNASGQAMYVTPTGDVGVGTDSPTASLHVVRDDGTSQVLVEEAGAVAPRTLFRLSNPGNTKFGVLNSDAGVEWAFANPGTGFRLSRQGSGFVEMEITNDGDLIIDGFLTELSDANAKQEIIPVDEQNILEKLKNLEISEWSYKDSPDYRHVGPMAQDFYATFGLGNTDKGIATLDSSGIALAAIKALINENESLKQRLQLLENQQMEMQAVMVRMLEDQQEQRILTRATVN